MKKIKYIIPMFLVMALSSCGNDFLDRSPISNANENDFFKAEADVVNALDGAYASLYTLYGPEGLSSFFGELMSDNCYTTNTAGTVSDYFQFQNHELGPENGIVKGYWEQYYSALFRVNNILFRMQPLDYANKAVHEGESKFLRGLYYFNMVQAWGGVPLVIGPLTVAESYAKGRATEAEIYAQVVLDLEDAAKLLGTTPRKAGAATSGAANALLGKVYLTMGDKAKATTALNKVYGKYALANTYADLWDMSKKNGKESIFEIQYVAGKANPYSRYWAMFSPLDNRIVTAWGAGMNQVTDDLWNEYEANDPRRDLSIFDGYTRADGTTNPVRFAKKWVHTGAELDGAREAAGNNFMVLRYADVLLMLSEATGDAKYLNEVRARVGLPLYGTSGYPSSKYSTVALAVEHERNAELALEFHRYFDLKRTGRAIDVMKASGKNQTLTTDILVLPIPLDIITQSSVITQNPGYVR